MTNQKLELAFQLQTLEIANLRTLVENSQKQVELLTKYIQSLEQTEEPVEVDVKADE